MAQLSKKDLKILQDVDATTIQSFWRMILGKQYIRWRGVLGGTARAAYREKKKAQDLANKVDREQEMLRRLRNKK